MSAAKDPWRRGGWGEQRLCCKYKHENISFQIHYSTQVPYCFVWNLPIIIKKCDFLCQTGIAVQFIRILTLIPQKFQNIAQNIAQKFEIWKCGIEVILEKLLVDFLIQSKVMFEVLNDPGNGFQRRRISDILSLSPNVCTEGLWKIQNIATGEKSQATYYSFSLLWQFPLKLKSMGIFWKPVLSNEKYHQIKTETCFLPRHSFLDMQWIFLKHIWERGKGFQKTKQWKDEWW